MSEFIEAFQKLIAPDSWKEDGVGILEVGGAIYVSQSEKVHVLIRKFLSDLARQRQRQVVLRLHQLGKPPPDSGDQWDAKQWSAMGKQKETAVLVQGDGEAGYHFAGVQKNYLGEERLVDGLHRPLVTTLSAGTILEVLPLIGTDGVQADIHLNIIASPAWAPMPLLDDHGLALFTLTRPSAQHIEMTEVRFIPKDGATLFRLGDKAYALTAEVLDSEQDPGR